MRRENKNNTPGKMCIFALNVAQKRLAAGYARTHWKSLQRSPTSPSWIKEKEVKRKSGERTGKEGRKERKGKEGKGREGRTLKEDDVSLLSGFLHG